MSNCQPCIEGMNTLLVAMQERINCAMKSVESPATAPNIDYTAALREELMQFLEDESPVLFEDIDFIKLAKRLNAVLQKKNIM